MQTKPATNDHSLTELIVRYQQSGEGLPAILERTGPLVYDFPSRRRGSTEDDCGDFFCEFFPKLPALIRRFRYEGVEFEAYLYSCLRWQYKTFARAKSRKRHAIHTFQGEPFWSQEDLVSPDVADLTLKESPSPTPVVSDILRLNSGGVIEDPIAARRLILLLLKASQEADEVIVRRIAELTGTSYEWLANKVGELHARLEERRERRSVIRRRRDQAYFRLHYFEFCLAMEVDVRERRRLSKLISQERVHLQNARSKLSRVPVCPTHRDIAEALEMPKGSVDSALYYLKRSLRSDEAHGPN